MKRKFKILISCIMTLIFLIIFMSVVTNLVKRKDSYSKYEDFFEETENFDVLFLGSSHMINGIYPMELWNDYGIVSYNMGGHGNRMPTNYVVLKEALNYTTPKLVVIDCFHVKSDRMYSDSIEQVHLSLDAFPLTFQKLQGIHELIDDRTLEAEFIWNFVTYHNRWDSLTSDDFSPTPSVEKGSEIKVNVAVPNEIISVPAETKLEEDTKGITYLRKTIELCQNNNIDVLLLYLPFPSTQEDQAEANRVNDIAQEYDVPYINFLKIDDIVNYNIDCLDEGSHLNASGGKKVSEYVGEYLIQNCAIPDQRSNPQYSDWNNDFQEYMDFKISLLEKETSLKNYLMLLRDNDLTYQIAINSSSDLLADTTIQELLHNLDGKYAITAMNSEISLSVEVLFQNKVVDYANFKDHQRIME